MIYLDRTWMLSGNCDGRRTSLNDNRKVLFS